MCAYSIHKCVHIRYMHALQCIRVFIFETCMDVCVQDSMCISVSSKVCAWYMYELTCIYVLIFDTYMHVCMQVSMFISVRLCVCAWYMYGFVLIFGYNCICGHVRIFFCAGYFGLLINICKELHSWRCTQCCIVAGCVLVALLRS